VFEDYGLLLGIRSDLIWLCESSSEGFDSSDQSMCKELEDVKILTLTF